MKKILKIFIAIICVLLVLGMCYGIFAVAKNFKHDNVTINPTYHSTLEENTKNNLWVGTLDLAWKNLEERLGVDRIQIDDEDIPQIAIDLNASNFTKDMLNEKDYEITVEKIMNGNKIYAKLNKDLHFLESFDNFNDLLRKYPFGKGQDYIKYFGINSATLEETYKNVEVLFFNEVEKETNEFAVALKTKEGDEIILYRTNDEKSFDEYYEDILKKTERYEGSREFLKYDQLLIPYTRVDGTVTYDEMLGKVIKGTNGSFFCDFAQDVSFYLNERGCTLKSVSTIADTTLGINRSREFYFNDTFIIFMKEKNAMQPYFALKVDNDDLLERLDEEYDGLYVFDFTVTKHESFDISNIETGEYKFYEDDKYEYYYPTHKTEFVRIGRGEIKETAEEALKNGTITIDLLDRFGIEYIKKEK